MDQYIPDAIKGTEVWYFYTNGCPWCQKLKPVLDEFLAENPQVGIVRINVEEDPEAADMNGIQSFPVIIPVIDGYFKQRIEGYVEKDKIAAAVFGE